VDEQTTALRCDHSSIRDVVDVLCDVFSSSMLDVFFSIAFIANLYEKCGVRRIWIDFLHIMLYISICYTVEIYLFLEVFSPYHMYVLICLTVETSTW